MRASSACFCSGDAEKRYRADSALGFGLGVGCLKAESTQSRFSAMVGGRKCGTVSNPGVGFWCGAVSLGGFDPVPMFRLGWFACSGGGKAVQGRFCFGVWVGGGVFGGRISPVPFFRVPSPIGILLNS